MRLCCVIRPRCSTRMSSHSSLVSHFQVHWLSSTSHWKLALCPGCPRSLPPRTLRVSLKADRTTARRPHSLDDCAARLHAPRICLITTAHRCLALINRLCGIVRLNIATAQQMMYAFHGPFIYYNRICIGVKHTQIKTQMYQLMLALFGRLICWRLQELYIKCDSCNK